MYTHFSWQLLVPLDPAIPPSSTVGYPPSLTVDLPHSHVPLATMDSVEFIDTRNSSSSSSSVAQLLHPDQNPAGNNIRHRGSGSSNGSRKSLGQNNLASVDLGNGRSGGTDLGEEDDEKSFNSEISLDELPEKLKRKLRREERKKKEREKRDRKLFPNKKLLKMQDTLLYMTTRVVSFLTRRPVPQLRLYKETDIVLEEIDSTSRLWFPTTYLLLMLVYWTTYLYIMPDEILLEIPENALVQYHSG